MSDPDALREDSDDPTIQSTWSAIQEGMHVVHLPRAFEPDDLPKLLEEVAPARATLGVLEGKHLPQETYEALHRELERRSVTLINAPEEHRILREQDRALPLLGDLTPRTVVIDSLDEVADALSQVGLPAFIKGSVLSLKHLGWKRCVANTENEALSIARQLLEEPSHSRGRILVRSLVPLRRARVSQVDFPPAREFRLVLYRKQIVALGFYWPWILDFADLAEGEPETLFALAKEAASKVPAPYVSVDVGQLESGEWTVIELGDPQVSASSMIDYRKSWRRLREVVAAYSVL